MAKRLDTPEERLAAAEKSMLIFFWEPYEWQKKAIEVMHKKTTMLAVASNKIGKTAFGACIVSSWALGYEPWAYVDPESEGAVCEGGV